TTLPGYYPIVDADVWSLARARSLVRSLRTPAAYHSLSAGRNADGRRVHFRMRLGASSRRRKRAPSRSSSTIATATAASAGHSRFFTTAYYTRRLRHTHTHTHAYIYTRGKTRSTVDGNLAFYLHYARAVHTHTHTHTHTHIRRFFRYSSDDNRTLRVVPDPWPIYFVRHQNEFSIIIEVYRLRF
ncbi:Uncharacterized protein FWK35_00003849, partial [Aphis craccivora]